MLRRAGQHAQLEARAQPAVQIERAEEQGGSFPSGTGMGARDGGEEQRGELGSRV